MLISHQRISTYVGVTIMLTLSACGALHEEIPAGVDYQPGEVDVRAPGSDSGTVTAGTTLTSTDTLSATEATTTLEVDRATLAAMSLLDPADAAAGVAPEAAARGAEAAAADVTGDLIADLILAESDGRLLVASHGDGAWAMHEMPVLPAGLSLARSGPPSESGAEELPDQWHLGETVDIDGDGVDEVAVWRDSGDDAQDMSLLRWDGTAFQELLAVPSVSRAADPWEIAVTRSADGAGLRIACSPLSGLGSLGEPARIVTRTHSWNDQDGGLEISDLESGAAPAPARASLTAAENALRSGDLDTAEALFQEAAAAQPQGLESGLAMFRLGLTYALAGRAAQARIAVANALDAPNGLSVIADAFLRGYDTSDAARALATARTAASSLEPPLEPRDILWEGHEIAAWIAANSVSSLADGGGQALGLDLDATVDAAVADLDGDGTDEAAILMFTELTGQPTLWLVDPAPPDADPGAGTLVLPIAQGADAMALSEMNSEPALNVTYLGRDLLLTWDGSHAALRSADRPEQILGYAAGTDPRPGHEPCSP